MTDISASFGLTQLYNIDDWHKRRMKIVGNYSDQLKILKGIICPNVILDKHSWHLYVIQIYTEKWKIDRDEIINRLNNKGIGTSVHYIPVHMHSYYQKKYGYKDEDYPNAKRLSETVISLPLYPALKSEEIIYITDELISLWQKFQS